MDEIQYIRIRCRTNFGGFWELDHASYEGDLDDLPAEKVEWWFQVINTMNHFINDRNQKNKK